MKLEVRPDLAELFSADSDPFVVVSRLEGRVYRQVAGRRTLRFRHGEKNYFLKLHSGVGWREVFKNLASLRLPVLGATNEYLAIRRLKELGVATLTTAAFARRGINPAGQQSFIITDELPPSVTLEDLCAEWPVASPGLRCKRALIRRVADIGRRLHDSGVNHRDFYLCHFHLDSAVADQEWPVLYLIDLHRAQLRRTTPRRWRLKDVAGLYFSALDIGLTRNDRLAFIRDYTGLPLRAVLSTPQVRFWQQVERKARQLYRKVHGLWPKDIP